MTVINHVLGYAAVRNTNETQVISSKFLISKSTNSADAKSAIF